MKFQKLHSLVSDSNIEFLPTYVLSQQQGSQGALFVIRIVGLQRSDSAAREFVLLQNQGSMRMTLRGHIIVSDSAVEDSNLSQAAHVFSDDVLIPAGMYVLLFTGHGNPRWTRTRDGALVYYAYMGRDRSVWDRTAGPLHILNTHHTFCERAPALMNS